MRVSGGKRIERLRGDCIEQGVDGVCVGSLYSGIGLETHPSRILLVDVVVEADGLHLFMIVAGVRNALPVSTTYRDRTAEYRDGCTAGISVERKHLLIKRNQRRWKLLQDVLLECGSRNNRRRDDGQRNSHPFAVE